MVFSYLHEYLHDQCHIFTSRRRVKIWHWSCKYECKCEKTHWIFYLSHMKQCVYIQEVATKWMEGETCTMQSAGYWILKCRILNPTVQKSSIPCKYPVFRIFHSPNINHKIFSLPHSYLHVQNVLYSLKYIAWYGIIRFIPYQAMYFNGYMTFCTWRY